MIKKLGLMISSIVLIMGVILPTVSFAAVEDDVVIPQMYTYTFNGIEISSNLVLTDSELEVIYNDAVLETVERERVGDLQPSLLVGPRQNDLNAPLALDPGSTTIRELGPIYKTSNNTTFWSSINFIISTYGLGKIKAISDSKFKSWLGGVFLAHLTPSNYVYSGHWVGSAWNQALGYRTYSDTTVFYKNSNYTGIDKIYYYDVTHWWVINN